MTTATNVIKLSTAESRALRQLARSRESIALRAQIIVACSEGVKIGAISRQLNVSRETVRKWRDRFQQYRLDGLSDRPRLGPPRTISEESARCVVAATLELPAPGGRRWTTRSMATAWGLSQTTVSRIWRDAGLRPDLVAAWRLVFDESFVARVRCVAGVLLAPEGGALALRLRSELDESNDPNAIAASDPVVQTQRDATWLRDMPQFLDAVDSGPSGQLRVLCSNERALATYPVRYSLARKPHIRCYAAPLAARWSVLLDRWLSAVPCTPQVARLRTHALDWTASTDLDCLMPWPSVALDENANVSARACPCRLWGDPDYPAS